VGGKEGWTLSIFKDDFAQRLVPEEVHRDYVVASEPGQTAQYRFSDPRFVQSMQTYVEFGTTHKAFADGFLGRSFAEGHQYFATGQAAMLVDGSWAAGTALLPTEAPDIDFGWMLLPPLSPDLAPKFLTYAGNAVMIMKGPRSDAAKQFVSWLVSKEQHDKVAASGVLVPARTDVDPEQMKKGNSPALISQWENLNIIGTMDPWGDYAPAELVQRDYQLAQELLLGTISPEDAAAQLDQIADELRAGP
jgi:ABC-type glycerol-3-phosphate transport system substrate-binding protein